MAAQQAQGTKKQNFNWIKWLIILVFIAGLVTFIVWIAGGFNTSYKEIDQGVFENWLRSNPRHGSIKDVVTSINGHYITGTIAEDGALGLSHNQDFKVHASASFIADLTTSGTGKASSNELHNLFMDASNRLFKEAEPEGRSIWLDLLISLLPMILMLSLLFFFMRKSSGGASDIFSPGKNQARKIISKKRFSDVAGQQEVKEEIEEVVDFLKNPTKYQAAGARIPKGILLGGPPGTGKTLLAKATAGEAGVPFFFIAASNFVEMFAGVGAKRVREMFKDARKAAPAILFIDELDAIGRKRGSSFSGNDEREQTLNQILVEMDGMAENGGLVLIAATNRPDVLDPALLRPGRFDRTITVSNPDIRERELILELHAKGKRISKEVDFAKIAKRTPGHSGAQLENIINEATLLSVREETGVITLEQIDEAIDRVAAGPAKKHRVISPEELEMVAYHEAGHAVIGLKVSTADMVQKITIIPRGNAGGYNLMTPKKEKYNFSKSELEAKIVLSMGGRAAEQIIYGDGEVSTGASNDIEKATQIARAMVTQYGMSILGPIAYERDQGPQFLGSGDFKSKEYSDALAERIDEAIRDLIITAEKKAKDVILKNKKLLKLIAEELLEKETIVYEEIEHINKHLKRLPKKKNNEKIKKSKSVDEIINDVKSNTQTTKIKKNKYENDDVKNDN